MMCKFKKRFIILKVKQARIKQIDILIYSLIFAGEMTN
jgi:hypothetical protein